MSCRATDGPAQPPQLVYCQSVLLCGAGFAITVTGASTSTRLQGAASARPPIAAIGELSICGVDREHDLPASIRRRASELASVSYGPRLLPESAKIGPITIAKMNFAIGPARRSRRDCRPLVKDADAAILLAHGRDGAGSGRRAFSAQKTSIAPDVMIEIFLEFHTAVNPRFRGQNRRKTPKPARHASAPPGNAPVHGRRRRC